MLAAIPCWGRHLALSKEVLKKRGRRGLFDLGNAEIILPIAEQVTVPVRQRIRYVSELNAGRISTLRPQRADPSGIEFRDVADALTHWNSDLLGDRQNNLGIAQVKQAAPPTLLQHLLG